MIVKLKKVIKIMKRIRRWEKKSPARKKQCIVHQMICLVGVMAVLMVCYFWQWDSGTKHIPNTNINSIVSGEDKGYVVKKVIDGDTFSILYQGKLTSVRLIGIDTPESVHRDHSKNTSWGKKASKYTKKKLTGETVYLQWDQQKTDQYGRLLAYVYIKQDEKYLMFNQMLVEKGYARAVCYEPNHIYRETFELIQEQAKKEKRGFWKTDLNIVFPE